MEGRWKEGGGEGEVKQYSYAWVCVHTSFVFVRVNKSSYVNVYPPLVSHKFSSKKEEGGKKPINIYMVAR